MFWTMTLSMSEPTSNYLHRIYWDSKFLFGEGRLIGEEGQAADSGIRFLVLGSDGYPYRNFKKPLILSENASSLKVQDELMDKLFFTQMGLSFGRAENPFDCFNCTYNGEICHSVSWNKTEHPYRGQPVHHLPMVGPISFELLIMIHNLWLTISKDLK